jgi:hypothetical protein
MIEQAEAFSPSRVAGSHGLPAAPMAMPEQQLERSRAEGGLRAVLQMLFLSFNRAR